MLDQLVDLADEVVMELLQLALAVLDVVFGDFLELLQAIAPFGSRVTDADPAFFGQLVHDFHQVLAPLLVERGDRHPDHATLTLRVELELRLANRFFDRVGLPLVPGRHEQEPWLGCAHARYLIEPHRLAVGLDAHRVQERRARFARADGRELLLRVLQRLVHRGLRVLQDLRDGRWRAHESTMVPTDSPRSARATECGALMFRTMSGSRFSLHSVIAVWSMTPSSWRITSL